MSPYIARQSVVIEMGKEVRDFIDLRDFVRRLRAAGYSDRDIIEYGYDVWRGEKSRRRAMQRSAA